MTNILETVIEELPEDVKSLLDRPEELAKKFEESPELAQFVFQLLAKRKEGLKRAMDPIFEAALVERKQFDHDVPEHRTGPLPNGVMPAVPVKTASLNPVVVGVQLKEASSRLYQAIVDMWEASEDGVKRDHPDYPTGALPKPQDARDVEVPPSFEERQEAAFWALSTTQGRRSVVDNVWSAIAELLPFQVEKGEGPVHVASDSWTVGIDGFKSWNPSFSIYTTAAAAVAAGLQRQLEQIPENLKLNVVTVDEYGDRRVGWRATLTA